MITYVAFLRGINSGQNPSTKMEVLRSAFNDLGFRNTKTVLASGNVIFDSNATNVSSLEAKIEATLPSVIGFKSEITVKNMAELKKLVESNPFKVYADNPQNRLYVTFIKQPAKTEISFPYHGDGYVILDNFQNIICSVINSTQTKTPDLMRFLDKVYGNDVTTRNWNTLQKIAKT